MGKVVTQLGEVVDKPKTTVGDGVSTFVRVTTLDIYDEGHFPAVFVQSKPDFLDEILRFSNLTSGNKPHI